MDFEFNFWYERKRTVNSCISMECDDVYAEFIDDRVALFEFVRNLP